MINKYNFNLPIGDWSDDGHGKCDFVFVESNKPVEEVREVHFKIKEVTGIDIHNIANEYDESVIDEDDPVIEYLKSKEELRRNVEEYNGRYYATVDFMSDLWIMLLQDTDPTLKLKKVVAEKIPMLSFFGYDEKKRHIGFVGYGTF
jgi:hypothetical protein